MRIRLPEPMAAIWAPRFGRVPARRDGMEIAADGNISGNPQTEVAAILCHVAACDGQKHLGAPGTDR